jgi:DNA-binding NarL/FixJ family response regulator
MASQEAYRIALADDHALFRQGLKKVLEGNENLEVVAEAGDGIELILALHKYLPNLVIVDISMPNLQGIETLQQIRMKYPGMKILMLTMHKEREYLTAALWAGADGYLLKDYSAEDLFSAIDTIRQGKGFVSPFLRKDLEMSGGKLSPHFLKYLMDS